MSKDYSFLNSKHFSIRVDNEKVFDGYAIDSKSFVIKNGNDFVDFIREQINDDKWDIDEHDLNSKENITETLIKLIDEDKFNTLFNKNDDSFYLGSNIGTI